MHCHSILSVGMAAPQQVVMDDPEQDSTIKQGDFRAGAAILGHGQQPPASLIITSSLLCAQQLPRMAAGNRMGATEISALRRRQAMGISAASCSEVG